MVYVSSLVHHLFLGKVRSNPLCPDLPSEAEYRALAQATCDAEWLIYLLNDHRVYTVSPAVLYCDNQEAIHIAANPVFHERTMHIGLDCHCQGKITNGTIHLLPVSSQSQLANIFTKSLVLGPFTNLQSKVGMLDIHIPA